MFLERKRRNALPVGEGSPVGDGWIDAGLARRLSVDRGAEYDRMRLALMFSCKRYQQGVRLAWL